MDTESIRSVEIKINLYQGLKLEEQPELTFNSDIVEIKINLYQGLKQTACDIARSFSECQVEIKINLYQGLKLRRSL